MTVSGRVPFTVAAGCLLVVLGFLAARFHIYPGADRGATGLFSADQHQRRLGAPRGRHAAASVSLGRQGRGNPRSSCSSVATRTRQQQLACDIGDQKESNHRRGMKRRLQEWDRLWNIINSDQPHKTYSATDKEWTSAYIHWSVEPSWTCQVLKRYGTLGDGGKVLCDPKRMMAATGEHRPLVYSFGSKLECDFEKDLKSDCPLCEVHVFDPTPGLAENWPTSKCVEFGTHHDIGLGGYIKTVSLDGMEGHATKKVQLKDLFSIQAELGHRHRVIDVLKIDVEGSEFDAFSFIAKHRDARQWLGAKIIILEVHLLHPSLFTDWIEGLTAFKKLFSDFAAMGYRLYYKEVNVFAPRSCVEYALVHERYLA